MADEVAAREAADALRGAFPAPSVQVLERVEAAITAAARERAGGASPVSVLQRRRRTPAVLRAAACLLVVVLVLPTATAATAQTLPGDSWHPLQIVLERLWVTAAPGGLASARVELRLADRRLVAADRAVDAGRVDAVPLLLALFHRHLQEAQRLGGASVAAEVAALRIRAASHLTAGVAEGAAEPGQPPPVGRDAGVPMERPPMPVPALPPPTTASSAARGPQTPAADAGAGSGQARPQPVASPSPPPAPSPSQAPSPRQDPAPADDESRKDEHVVPPPAASPTERDDDARDRPDDEPDPRGDAGDGRETEPDEDPQEEESEDGSADGDDGDGDDGDGKGDGAGGG